MGCVGDQLRTDGTVAEDSEDITMRSVAISYLGEFLLLMKLPMKKATTDRTTETIRTIIAHVGHPAFGSMSSFLQKMSVMLRLKAKKSERIKKRSVKCMRVEMIPLSIPSFHDAKPKSAIR